MNITNQKKYALVDIPKKDMDLIIKQNLAMMDNAQLAQRQPERHRIRGA
ncbi:MAG: hypothetical protein WKG07_11285 [Hymenobacter sp.]